MKWMLLSAPTMVLGALVAHPALAQDYAVLSASMLGVNVPEGGADKAAGDFNGEADFTKSRICYYLDIYDLADADGAAIHEGTARANGPAVVTLSVPQGEAEEVCVSVDKTLLERMRQRPQNYYVAVRSPAHPNGAIRGQLGE